MKKIFVFFVVFVLLSSFVLAAENQERNMGQNNAESGDLEAGDDSDVDSEQRNEVREQVRESKKTMSQLREQALSEIKELKVQNAAELREAVRERREQLKEAVKEEREKVREMKEKQNEARLAIHTLLAAENLTNMGKEVGVIARDLDNSAKETEQTEEKIMNRGRFMKFLFGGDRDGAELIRNRIQAREEKIQELKNLIDTCNCDDEVKALLQEQVRVMQQEQERLNSVADEEGKDTGLFGWMFK